jgi:hypothetical protein
MKNFIINKLFNTSINKKKNTWCDIKFRVKDFFYIDTKKISLYYYSIKIILYIKNNRAIILLLFYLHSVLFSLLYILYLIIIYNTPLMSELIELYYFHPEEPFVTAIYTFDIEESFATDLYAFDTHCGESLDLNLNQKFQELNCNLTETKTLDSSNTKSFFHSQLEEFYKLFTKNKTYIKLYDINYNYINHSYLCNSEETSGPELWLNSELKKSYEKIERLEEEISVLDLRLKCYKLEKVQLIDAIVEAIEELHLEI